MIQQWRNREKRERKGEGEKRKEGEAMERFTVAVGGPESPSSFCWFEIWAITPVSNQWKPWGDGIPALWGAVAALRRSPPASPPSISLCLFLFLYLSLFSSIWTQVEIWQPQWPSDGLDKSLMANISLFLSSLPPLSLFVPLSSLSSHKHSKLNA